jgi:hypothetical protein
VVDRRQAALVMEFAHWRRPEGRLENHATPGL